MDLAARWTPCVEVEPGERLGPAPWPDGMVELFSAKRAGLVRLACVITGSNEVAEEIVQEAFVRLRPQWARLDNPGGYLRVSVVNLSRTWLRRQHLERRHAAAGLRDNVVTGDPEIDETWAAVCRLAPRQRAVLALRFYEDMAEADIARILGCHVGTVKSTVHRALARLRKELS